MIKISLAALLLMTAAIPAAADASTRCREARHNQQVTGTVVGAIAGGLVGNAVSRGGGKTGGTVIGAVGGAVIGNQLASQSGRPCPDGYEAYEDDERHDVAAQQQYAQPQYVQPQYVAPEPARDGRNDYGRSDQMHHDDNEHRNWDHQDGRGHDWDHHDGRSHDWDRQTFDHEWGARGADWDHRWQRGEYLPDNYATDERYYVRDYRDHSLSKPRRGYHWTRYGRGYVLVRSDGYVDRFVLGDHN